jgi:hypothetical protein
LDVAAAVVVAELVAVAKDQWEVDVQVQPGDPRDYLVHQRKPFRFRLPPTHLTSLAEN